MLNTASPVSPTAGTGRKRPRLLNTESNSPRRHKSSRDDHDSDGNEDGEKENGPAKHSPPTSASTSSFRNVSACHRCRLRKNRCDQHLPRCNSCEKAGVRCVGYDPITKREIPRSYVYFLEARVAYLEKLLRQRDIGFKDAVAFGEEMAVSMENGGRESVQAQGLDGVGGGNAPEKEPQKDKGNIKKEEEEKEDALGSNSEKLALAFACCAQGLVTSHI